MVILKELVLLFLVIISTSFSAISQTQYLKWVDAKNSVRNRIDLEQQVIEEEISPGEWKATRKVKVLEKVLEDLPKQITNNYFQLASVGKIWFTVSGTGYILVLDSSTNELTRLDRTYYRGYNFDASQFFRKGILYSFGGYGFWHSSNALTYFDTGTAEWQSILPKNYGPKTIQSGYQGYDSRLDVYYSGASEEQQDILDIERKFSNEVFKLNFKDLSWEKLGEINSDLPFTSRTSIFWNGHYFFQWAINKLYIIDPAKNNVRVFDNHKLEIGTKEFYANADTLYCYMENGTTIIKYPIKEVLSASKYVGEFYSNRTYMYYMAVLLILILAGIFGYVLIRNRKHQPTGKLFNHIEKQVLDSLLERGSLTTQDLNDILKISSKSLDNQRRIRLDIIKQLNDKIHNAYGIQTGVDKEPDNFDRRLNIYSLNTILREILLSKGQ
jgi:hypothetical protein